MGFCERNEIHEDSIACLLFAFMFGGNVLQWCVIFPATSIHSFDHLIGDLSCAFYHYDCKALNKKILQLQKKHDESLLQF